MTYVDIGLIILAVWNLAVAIIYGIDKLLARAGRRRISEATLLFCAFLLGGLGAILGMVLFNHKTSKTRFRILVPLYVIILIAALYLCFRFVI